MAAADTSAIAAVLADALADAGRAVDDLSVTEAMALAEGLRTIVAALPAPTPLDVRLAADLIAAASIIERHAGTG